ncbi:MAG: hypothetical protein BGP21_03415 [Thiobacillus sp. 65-29]|jgi:ribonuclease T2|nr:MAG: hypothetical protein BGP21_03415 [Thiobacillus sp. 65-29]
MAGMSMSVIWLVLALLATPFAGAAEPAHFDHYVLALAIAPAFCEDDPQQKRNDAQCRARLDATFRGRAYVDSPLD